MKLPFILGSSMTIIIGIINFTNNVSNQEIYVRMAIGMVVFYLLGFYIRSTVIKIEKEVRKKKLQEELEKIKELKKQADEKADSEANLHVIDFRIDDSDEDFLPLETSKAIKSALSEHGKG